MMKKTNLNAMFKAVKLPTSIADLDTGLSNVDRNALSHFRRFSKKRRTRKIGKFERGEEKGTPEAYTKTSLGEKFSE